MGNEKLTKVKKKKSKLKKWIHAGLLAAAVGVGVWTTVDYFAPQYRIVLGESKEIDLKTIQGNKKTIIRASEDYLNKFFPGYVDHIAKDSFQMRINVSHYGRQKVIDTYVEAHRKCLATAVNTLDRDVEKSDIDNLVTEWIKHMQNNSIELFIDQQHKAVYEGDTAYVVPRVEFFRRVLKASVKNKNLPEDTSFESLVKRGYTKPEFEEYLRIQGAGRQKMYDGFAKSLENFRSLVPGLARYIRDKGPGIANKTRELSSEYHQKELEMIFGDQ